MLTEAAVYLGPARILEGHGLRWSVAIPGANVLATLACGQFYRPVPDDTVLVIGQGESYYVIGAIQSSGDTVIQSQRNVTVIAPNGTVDLFATRGMSLHSPSIRIRSTRLEIVARSVFEKFGNAYRWVKESLQVRAGRMRSVAKGSCHVKADRIVEIASKDVKIDGAKINLG